MYIQETTFLKGHAPHATITDFGGVTFEVAARTAFENISPYIRENAKLIFVGPDRAVIIFPSDVPGAWYHVLSVASDLGELSQFAQKALAGAPEA